MSDFGLYLCAALLAGLYLVRIFREQRDGRSDDERPRRIFKRRGTAPKTRRT